MNENKGEKDRHGTAAVPKQVPLRDKKVKRQRSRNETAADEGGVIASSEVLDWIAERQMDNGEALQVQEL